MRFLYQPSETFRANFTAQIFDENRNGSAQKGLLDTTTDPRKLRQNSKTEHKLEASLYSAVLEWDYDAFSIKSLTSHQVDDILVRRTMIEMMLPIYLHLRNFQVSMIQRQISKQQLLRI